VLLSAEASQLESPTSHALPGFGRAGFDSLKARRSGAAGGAAGHMGGSTQLSEDWLPLRDFVWGMFERFCEPLLQWVATKGKLVVQLSAATLMSSVTTLFENQLNTLHK
jgi:hypothetical protein